MLREPTLEMLRAVMRARLDLIGELARWFDLFDAYLVDDDTANGMSGQDQAALVQTPEEPGIGADQQSTFTPS